MGEISLTLCIFLLFILLDLTALITFIGIALHRDRQKQKEETIKRLILEQKDFPSRLPKKKQKKSILLEYLKAYRALCQSIELPKKRQEEIITFFCSCKLDIHLIRSLTSPSRYKRTQAASYLAHLPSPASRKALIWALEKEKLNSVRLILVYAIVKQGSKAALPSIIDSLSRSSLFYAKRIAKILSGWSNVLGDYFSVLRGRKEAEIQSLLLELCRSSPKSHYKEYVQSLLEEQNRTIRREAFRVLAGTYADAIDFSPYLEDEDEVIRGIAVEASSKGGSANCCESLLPLLENPQLKASTLSALDNTVRESPGMLSTLLDSYLIETSEGIRGGLLQILATKAEYFIGTMLNRDDPRIPPLIQAFYINQRITGIINFLNRNRNPEISDRIIAILKPVLSQNNQSAAEMRNYLNEEDLLKLGLPSKEAPREKRKESRDTNKAALLIPTLLIAAALVPILFFLTTYTGESTITDFILFFNYLFAYYAFALNGSYLLILILSALGLFFRTREWEIKERLLLFIPGILPKISIIAPAYNEEQSIIESINSLLSLDYPRFEVIVVNDGSSDKTLDRTISYFELERTWKKASGDLETGEIRGVYSNPRYPNFILIDKKNGGKADSLNSGINFASGSYFAGIDSDSLLEPDALLKLSAAFLDREERVVATGGNIFPINGSKVRRGHILKKRVPRNPLAKIQTMEYIRAFMAGRIGWSFIRALLIISGAFGLFHRREVIAVRGYLTGKELYHKDTVGEDMELVVRLQRTLREAGKSFAILYQHNANCWTEVPETWKVFTKQRDRWQRGLIDIIHFHRKMILNRRYGNSGLIAFPYYLLFEIFGPLIEAQGYVVVLISLILGILTPSYLLLLLSATILFGVLISIISLIFAQWSGNRFSHSDRFQLILTALGENFGPRQVISLLRVKGFFSSLRMVSGWGKMERRGFK